MDQMEDKGLLLKQYLREMESGLKEKEARLLQVTQSFRHLESELSHRREELRKMEEDLQLAVRREKDDIARVLIRKRRTLQGTCEQLGYQLEGLSDEKRQLAETLDRQRLQYDQMKIKVASFGRQSVGQGFEGSATPTGALSAWQEPTQEEIELELLQRKEALHKGGAT
jgi:phage shock protein A